jgi:hypothetical protein
VADRIASAGYDPRKTLRRYHWLERWPVLSLAATAVVVTALLLDGRWEAALVVAGLVVPDRIYAWRTRATEREALVLDGDFFERERTHLEDRLLGEEVRAGAVLAVALLLGSIAAFRPEPAPMIWVLAAVIAVVAVVRLAVLGPALSRELRDLGGEPTGVRAAVVVVAVVMLLPILVAGRLVYRGVRRLIGRPVKVDEDDE